MGILDSAAAVVSGLLGKGPVSAPDLTALFDTIKASGVYQKDLINALPAEIKPLYDNYVASLGTAGQNLQAGVAQTGQNLLTATAANYGPEAAKAAEDAAKTAIYANLPAQQNAIRQALAATGGFDRGTATKQLAAPVIQAGQQFGQQVANITAQQLQAKQAATQQALNTISNMTDQAIMSVFGMSKDAATTILNSNRQDLKDQLTSLINQNTQQTQQTLGVQGVNIENQYNQQVAENARQNALTNAWVNLGANAAEAGVGAAGGWKGIAQGLGIGSSPVTTGSYSPYAPVNESMLP
jgi:hypothetical protein